MKCRLLFLGIFTAYCVNCIASESTYSLESEAFSRIKGPGTYCNSSADAWDYPQRATYLVIAADSFYDSSSSGLADFMNWKREKGYTVLGTRLSNISHSGTVVANTDIQSYIRAVYNGDSGYSGLPPLRYVLLVGECNLTASSVSTSVDVSSITNEVPTWLTANNFVTDQYYVNSLAKDSSNNYPSRYFFEYEGVVIGRISAETVTQCATVLDKILTYETNPPAGSWPDQFIGTCYFEDENPVDGVTENTTPDIIMSIYQVLTRQLGYNYDAGSGTYLDKIIIGTPNNYAQSPPYYFRSYAAPQYRKNIQEYAWDTGEFANLNQNWLPTPIPQRILNYFYPFATAHDRVNDALNDGASALIFSGHGATSGRSWSRFQYNTYRNQLRDMDGLDNGYMLPVFFSIVCNTGRFAEKVQSDGSEWRQCMCEAFPRYNSGSASGPGGAVAAVGCSAGADGTYSIPIKYGLFSALHGRDFDPINWDNTSTSGMGGLGELGAPTQRPAVALAWSKCWMADLLNINDSSSSLYAGAKKHWEMMNYFGDPELMMFTHEPIALSVQHPTVLSAVGHFSVTVTSGGTPIENARVALVHLSSGAPDPNEEPWVTITNAQGAADMLVLPSAGSYRLTVTGANCLPYSSTVTTNFTVIEVPSQYTNIQNAINAAPSSNAVIRIAPGSYTGYCWLYGKNIVIRSTNPRNPAVVDQTIWTPLGGSFGVKFSGTETASCAIAGLTIQGSTSYGIGSGSGTASAGVYYNKIGPSSGTDYVYGVYNVAGEIGYNRILDNDGVLIGSGIRGCNGHIHHNDIYGNDGGSYGYGIRISNGLIEFNEIHENGGDSGRGLSDCNGTIRANRIYDNTGTTYGYGIRYCLGTIEQNVIYNNGGPSFSAGLYACDGVLRHNTVYGNMHGIRFCSATSITNCISWLNSSTQVSTSTTPSYSCIQNWTGGGTGNLSSNPVFIDEASGDFRLDYTSPCLNAGTNLGLDEDFYGYRRLQGSAPDLGAIEYCY